MLVSFGRRPVGLDFRLRLCKTRSFSMLGDDEDVFDSVTWESPNAPPSAVYQPLASSGPGFRQSTSDTNDDPHSPRWEGYLITSVRDPVKELAETKDAYVSYLVSAQACAERNRSHWSDRCADKPPDILNS